ncbi:MAG TPA: class I SAM-dependent methyltransferase [Candidatus Acidoferrales bacterium]|jgi:SAM-dependent methyltransferase|nr:class I SAM-dependent methyltransferase [Candidatus Acidoferrales bacterium]
MTTFDELAEAYEAGRIGYSTELYNMLVGFGLNPKLTVIDVGCGTGLASRPLIENGFHVTGIDISEPMLEKARARFPGTWIKASAEKIPFPDANFDVAISAQTMHHLNRAAAMAEMVRVVKPGGIIAVWWKHLSGEDPVKMIRDDVASDLRSDPLPSGLAGGFKEFYAAPLTDHTLRVIPWQTMMGLEELIVSERSRKIVRDALGKRADEYFKRFEQRLRDRFGDGNPRVPLGYIQFLYVARKPQA